ncbi:MAG: hypothetical protein R3E66_01895 [bacterium]
MRKPSRQLLAGFGLAGLAALVAMLVPIEATHKVQDFMGSKSDRTPFVDATAALDAALAQGFDVAADEAQIKRSFGALAVRRLATEGRLASDDIPKLLDVIADYQTRIEAEPTPEQRQAVRAARNKALVGALPRFTAAQIDTALGGLETQIDRVSPWFEGGEAQCQSCHMSAAPLRGPIDTVGIWPHYPPDVFSNGFPVLTDTLEMRTSQPNATCLGCHVAHGQPDFLTSIADRQENMGMWVHAYRIEDLIYVQVKVQNRHAAHYVPGGYLDHAYAVVVDAYAGKEPGGERLPFWGGHTLPDELAADPNQSGYWMGRRTVDKAGNPTTASEAITVADDTRLEAGRFVDLTFLYVIPKDVYVPYSVVARLVYLPNGLTMDGAKDVEVRIRKSE